MTTMILDRSYQPVSVSHLGGKLEFRIHGEKPAGDAVMHLSVQEARVLAYGLLAEVEKRATQH